MIANRYIIGPGVLMRTDRSPGINSAGSCVVILSSGRRPFRLRAIDETRGALCTSAVIPPGTEYVIEGEDVERVTTFIEADGILGRRARYEMDASMRRGSTAWSEVGHRLVPADFWAYADADDWPAAFHRLACTLDRKRRGLASAGAQARHAAAVVESSLPERISVAALARAVNLTQEQLTRLLLDEVGLAARPFVYWLRLRRYASLLAAGATVGEATRATGYRRRGELMQELQRLFGFTSRDLLACERLAPLHDRAGSGSSALDLRSRRAAAAADPSTACRWPGTREAPARTR